MSAEMNAMMEAITKLTQAMTDVQQGGSGSRGGPPGVNERKKIDMRYIKVQEFEGKTEDWDTWSFSFKGGIRAQDKRAYDLIGKVEELVDDIDESGLDPNTEAISGELYNLLCQYCRGPAQSILRSVEDCCGLTAWQKLRRVYNPMTVARTIQALGEVTRAPRITDMSLAEAAISKWEEMLKKVERDYKQAAAWFQEAASQEYASAQRNLALCYKNGQGVERDFKQAVEWFHKAAAQGNAPAQLNLGLFYETEGFKQDFAQAAAWFRKASVQGIPAATAKLNSLLAARPELA